ncbi:MAG: metallophosphoesterase [Deltaproteobacteria bacterium]|nr:metallophosphoesterase [Deltaproteobacteria bacterium]
MTRIGVVSDTHLTLSHDVGPLARVLADLFAGVDFILHAGDITDPDIFFELFPDRRVLAVSGNMDRDAVAPPTLTIQVGDMAIAVAHGHGYAGRLPDALLSVFPDADAIVFGHTHVALCERRKGVLVFNPGSPLRPRDHRGGTVGILTVGDGRVDGEIVELRSWRGIR